VRLRLGLAALLAGLNQELVPGLELLLSHELFNEATKFVASQSLFFQASIVDQIDSRSDD
jgi:hypothetical protein